MKPLTLGTAGHIDHGKTALIRALTGVDTDRLPEERARGISIELGYASLTLPSGRRLSVVDVPGHERFVRTMVAGATGIDLFLMTIAADDGVMPQTREHAAVLRALGVTDRRGGGDQERPGRPGPGPDRGLRAAPGRRGGGRVGPDRGRARRAAGGARAGRRAVVSSRADAWRVGPPARRPRVHDPRCGHGGDRDAVVGPDRAGRRARGAAAGPPGARARRPGARRAGGPGAGRAARGGEPDRHRGGTTSSAATCWSRATAAVRPAYRVDAELEFAGREPEHGDRVQIHHGTREAPARLAWLGGRFWQIRLEQPLVPAAGDRLVVRQIAPPDTLGGGRVLDPAPRRHGPSRDTLARLERLARGEAPELTGRARAGGKWDPTDPPAPAHGRRAKRGPKNRCRTPRCALEQRLRDAGVEPPLDSELDAARPGRAARGRPRRAGVQDAALPRRRAAPTSGRGWWRSPRGHGGDVTLAQLRDELGTSRKFAQALLEHFDSERVTIRRGDAHVLRRGATHPTR